MIDRSRLPRVRLDAARSQGLKWRAPASALARFRPIEMAAQKGAGEIALTGVTGFDYTFDQVRNQLKELGSRPVRVLLNSPGGDAFEGIAIYDLLREHSARVTIAVYGIAASAASVIAMAGDRIEMGESSFLMIHSASGMVLGNAQDLAEFAALLTQIDESVADLYARRSGLSKAKVLELMRKETYISAADAVKMGFAEATFAAPDESKSKASASMRSSFSLPSLTAQTPAASGLEVQLSARTELFTPGVSGAGTEKGKTMTLQEKIAALREQRETKLARQGEIFKLMQTDLGSVSVEDRQEFDRIDGELVELDDQLRMTQFEARMQGSAVGLADTSRGAGNRSAYLNLKHTDQDEKFKGQNWTRKVIAMALAYQNQVSPILVAQRRWGKTNPTLVKCIEMAAVPGGGSDSGEWGSELVTADNRYTGDFIEYLYNMTVFDSLPLREVPANVTIKGTDGAATANWVGQSKAIKPTTGSASSVSLTPLKVAALAVVSNELLADSSPSAEQWVRDLLAEAMAQRVDQTFFSADAASAGVSPAGILNGLSALTSSGTDGDAVRTDIETLYAPFITARDAAGLVFVTTTGLAKAIQLMRNALGQREFPDVTSPVGSRAGTLEGDPLYRGDNVGSGDVILLNPREIWKIGDSGIQVAISREATIEQDTSATGATDTPTGMTTTNMTNMFQEDSTAIRLIRRINFQKRRTHAVAYIGDAGYGGVTS